MSIKSPLNRQFGTQFDSVFDVVKSNPMYDKSGGKIPSLDLNFAKSKSLRDSRSTKNLINFTRASSGTYVDSDGLIKTSPVNLLTYSEQIDQWTVAASSIITPNVDASPDGTITADGVYFGTVGNTNVSQNVTLTQNTTYTISVYAKAVTPGSNNKFKTYINSSNPKFPSIDFESTSEWQRFSFTFTHTDSTGTVPVFILNPGDNYITNVYFWGSQLEEGTTATDYIPTGASSSGAPRFDHDPSTGESLGLLIEGGRTNKMLRSENLERTFGSGAIWVGQNGATSSLSNITSPDGVSKMWLVNLPTPGNASSGSRLYQSGLAFNNVVNTFSFYARSVSGTGTFPVAYYNGTDYIKSYVTLTETTKRYIISCPSGISTAASNIFGFSRRGLTHDETLTQAYIWGCQVEQSSFATSYIATSDSTITRAADIATIEGNKFAKINLLKYSERFDQSAWTKQASVALTPNSITAPDGTTTGELYSISATAQRAIDQSISNLTNGVTYTFSIYIKAIVNTSVRIRLITNDIDPSDQSILVSEGWQRISWIFTKGSSHTSLGFLDNSGGTGDRFYIWGAQLEEGDELTQYTPSVETFVSRASSATYVDDATGLITTASVDTARYENGDLLLEPARTNLIKYSSDLSQSYWSKTRLTATAVQESNPFDYTDVYRVRATGGSSHELRPNVNNFTANTTSTFSAFATADGTGADAGLVQLRIYNLGHTSAIVNFDLSAGTANAADGLSGTTVNGHTWTISDYGLEPYGNGWYRVWMTAQVSSIGNAGFVCINSINADDLGSVYNYTSSETGGFLISGVQVEQGSFKTSAIPTSGSTVTRAADVSTSALGVDSWYNQSEGTIFSDISPLDVESDRAYLFSSGSNAQRLGQNTRSTSNFALFMSRSGATTLASAVSGMPKPIKACLAYKPESSRGIINGQLQILSTITAVPININQVGLGCQNFDTPSGFLNGHITRLAYFPTRLLKDKLKSITT
jgi:hypothetical protein